MLLQNGFLIKDISFQNFQINELYIKWDEKLSISAKKIFIQTNSHSKKNNFDYKNIYNIIDKLYSIDNFFKKIDLKTIQFNKISSSFQYSDNKGYFVAYSPSIQFKSYFLIKNKLFHIDIKEFKDKQRDIKIDGNIIFNNNSKKLTSSININIHNDAKLKLYLLATKNKLFYNLISKKRIKSINHIMELLPLNKYLEFWVYKAIDTKGVDIHSFYGWINYNNLTESLKNLYINANLIDLNYTYHKSLDAIHTKTTQLEFKNGILYIRPKEAYTYGYYLDKSWLKIDFTKDEELLTLNLLFDAKLDKNVLKILNTFKIKVPFLQNTGITKTDLTINVGLRTIHVGAKGNFFTTNSNFDYLGLKLDAYNAHIFLDGYNIKINNMLVKYKDIASTKVDVIYNAKNNVGNILFNINKINFEDYHLKLNQKNNPLKLNYTLSSDKDKISIEKQNWLFDNKKVVIDKISFPFNLKETTFTIPKTYIESKGFFKAFITGNNNIKNNIYNYNLNILSFNYKNIKLKEPNLKLKISLKDKLEIANLNKIKFLVNSMDSSLSPTKIIIKDKKLFLEGSKLIIKDILNTNLNANFSFITNSGNIYLKNTTIKNEYIKNLKLDVIKLKDRTIVKSTKLALKYEFMEDRWKLNIESLSKLSKYFQILKRYKLTNGKVYLYTKDSMDKIKFKSNIIYPFRLLVYDNNLIENYIIDGDIEKNTKKISLNINNLVNIFIDKDIKIKMNNIGINIKSLISLVKDLSSKEVDSNTLKINLKSINSYLYISENRHIISDTIDANYTNKNLFINLKHQNGRAKLILQNSNLNCYGDGFNDIFMENLFSLSKFKGGEFSFSIQGKLDENYGKLNIKNTTLIRFKVLNNILAFLNTIPSLVTLSIPNYDTKGLKVDTAYMEFNSKDYNFDIKKFNLNSKELVIDGGGNANFNTNKIDMLLNLRSDIGSIFSKIPIVGDILLGKETVSTTLKVKGDLNNPKIETNIGENIINAPVNILKRAILFPFHLGDTEEE